MRVRTMARNSAAEPGDRIRIKEQSSTAWRPALPGGFDDPSRTAWFYQVGAVGYAFAAPVIEGRADGNADSAR